MSTAARIEELRKKFEENPRRYFAPLANELRKAGDLSQAIALCREHLPKQPGHMSGYIVFGQALYETGELDEARGVFEQALSLDPENLIALRHLGDIARRQGQPHVARRWYERVLEADPRNDDIAAQLASLATPAFGAPAVGTPAYGAPVIGTPAYGTPAYGAIAQGTPAYGGAAYATPPLPSAAIPTPVAPTPIAAHVAVPTPVSSAPAIPTPISAAPAIPTPVAGISAVPTPIDSAALPVALPIDFDGMLSLTPVSTPVVAPLDGFHATNVTPASPTPSLGFASVIPAMPTPDAAMRAVESPNESLNESPIEPPADSYSDIPSEGLLDIDALGGIGVSTHASDAVADSDPFAFGASTDEASADVLAHADAENAEAAFEEGLVAPEWPDTAELVARRETPRHATPISVPVTTEAVEAFGREANDPVVVPIPEPELDLDSGLDDISSFVAAAQIHVAESVAAESVAAESVVDEEIVASFEPETAAAIEQEIETGNEQQFDATSEAPFATTALVTPPHVPAYAYDFASTPVDASGADEPDSALDPFETVEQATEQSVSAEASFANVFDAVESSDSDALAPDERMADSAEAGESDEVHETSPAFVTETMGELLVAQGFIDRAITVYEELVRRRPYDPVLSSRLGELRDMQEEARVAAVAVPTPVTTYTPVTTRTVTPLFMPVSTSSSTSASASVAAFTARERFAALASRRVARRTPTRPTPAISEAVAYPFSASPTPAASPVSAPPAEDSLAALFGSESHGDDDLAAQQLAEAFNPDAVDVGSLSDSFFAGAAGHREPTPAFGVSRQPTPLRSATPIASPVVTPSSASAPVNTGEFSFDRFFPDPARQATASGSAAGTDRPDDQQSSGPPATDDLAQFSAWLKGLGNS